MKLRTGTNLKALGFTLNEVLISLMVAGIGLSGTISAYVLSAKRAEWMLCSAAAQNQARQRLEQARIANWDTTSSPTVDELVTANFPTIQQPLPIPQLASTTVTGTVTTVITTISTDPPLKQIKVNCSWKLWSGGPFTNTLVTVRGPE